MTRIGRNTARTLRLLARAAVIVGVVAAPLLAVPSIAGQDQAVIEAPAQKNTGAGFVIMVSLMRG